MMIKQIEEAKSKVKPIYMTEEDRKKYIKSLEELKKDKEIDFIDPKGKEVLDSADINLEHLRKL